MAKKTSRRSSNRETTKESRRGPAQKTSFLSRLESTWIHVGLLIALAFVLYGNTVMHDYAVDDGLLITANKFTRMGFRGIPSILTTDTFQGYFEHQRETTGQQSHSDLSGGRYRPLSVVTFAIEHQFFGLSPYPSHFNNALLYAIGGVLIYFVLGLLLPQYNPVIPLTTSLLFLTHPLHTEAVANIKGRDEILCLVLLLLSLYLILRHLEERRRIYLVGSLLAYGLALLAKETAVTFLAVFPLAFYVFLNKSPKKSLGLTVPFLLIFVGYVILRVSLVGFVGEQDSSEILNNPFLQASESQRLATIMFTLGKYLGLLFFPHPLVSNYSYNQIPLIEWTSLKAIVPFVIHSGLGLFALYRLRSRDYAAFGILYYFITLSIVSNLLFPIGAPMAERFLFIPSLGFCLAIVVLLTRWLKVETIGQYRHQVAFLAIVGLLMVGFSFKSILRNRAWKNNFALYSADVKNSPNSASVHGALADTLVSKAAEEKDREKKEAYLTEAVHHLNEAIRIHPGYLGAHRLLGRVYDLMDDPKAALRHYQEAAALKPDSAQTHYYVGLGYLNLGQTNQAIASLQKAIQLNPGYTAAYDSLGFAYHRKGEIEAAIESYRKAIALNPRFAKAYHNLGAIYALRKEYDEAIKYFEKAIEMDPHYVNAYTNLARVYESKGDSERAGYYQQRAEQVRSSSRE